MEEVTFRAWLHEHAEEARDRTQVAEEAEDEEECAFWTGAHSAYLPAITALDGDLAPEPETDEVEDNVVRHVVNPTPQTEPDNNTITFTIIRRETKTEPDNNTINIVTRRRPEEKR